MALFPFPVYSGFRPLNSVFMNLNTTDFPSTCHDKKRRPAEKLTHHVTSQKINIFLDIDLPERYTLAIRWYEVGSCGYQREDDVQRRF